MRNDEEVKYSILFNLRKNGEMSISDLLGIAIQSNVYMGTSRDAIFCQTLLNLFNAKFIELRSEGKDFTRYEKTGADTSNLSDGYDFALRNTPESTYAKLTPFFYRVQEVVGFSVSDKLSGHSRDWRDPESIWGKPSKELRTQIFVIMPFSDVVNSVFEDHIQKVCRKIGYECKRADDIFLPNNVMHDVWSMIYNSNVIICDCTGRNPNVFYELGIAHTLGKNVICITQNHEDIPFDIKQIRYIKYDYTKRGMKAFEEKLEQFMAITMAESLAFL